MRGCNPDRAIAEVTPDASRKVRRDKLLRGVLASTACKPLESRVCPSRLFVNISLSPDDVDRQPNVAPMRNSYGYDPSLGIRGFDRRLEAHMLRLALQPSRPMKP
jgi:hypothetical protein